MNIFIQPEQPFPLAKPQPKTPPLWDLAHPNTIQVVYKDTAGGIVTADYTVDVTGTQVNRNAITNFNIGNFTTANYSFKNDAGAVAFSAPYKPWTNPYLPVTQGPDGPHKLLANFLTTLGVHNPPANPSCFDGRNDLPWEGTELNGRADFAARPSLGKILARSVLVNLPRVAMANDVQDLTMALQRLITKPVVHADLDEWFRAAVIYAGSKPDHGAVIRGLLLRVRKRGRLEADEFLKLINLADGGHGNAADWLRAQIVPGNDIHGSAAGLTAILTEFEARLGDIIALPNPPVNANLNNFLQGVVNASQVVRGVIAANVPACFNAHATTLDNMRTNDLPIQRIAYLGLNEYKREKAPFFIESSQAILPARKELIDADIKRRIVAANQAPPPHPPMGPPNVTRQRLAGDLSTPPYNNLFGAGNGQGVYSTLLAYMDGNRGQSAKTMAPKLAQMSNHEFVEHMESLVPLWQKVDSAWGGNTAGMGAMIQYYNPADGTLIRYKPGGDEYQRPQAPMYSVEVTRTNIADAMFKIDPNGNAVPFGPGGQTNANPYVGAEKSHYFDGISRAGHRSLRY